MRRRIMVAAAVALALVAGTAAAPAQASTASSPTAITVNRWVSGSLRSAAETDWYAFTLPGRAYVSVVLGDLPRNYNLALYDAAGTRLARADHAGTRFEAIDRVLPAGTYRVRVGSTSGSSSMAYSLIVRSVRASRFATLTARVHLGNAVVGEFVNASEQWAVVGRASATFFAADGRRLRSVAPTLLDGWYYVPPHGKVPFRLSLTNDAPAGTARVTVTPLHSFVPDRTATRLTTTVTERLRFTGAGLARVRTTATVRNGSSRAVRVALIDRAYNRRGVLSSVSFHDPRVLAAGTSGTFTTSLVGFPPSTMARMTLSAKAFEAANSLPTP